VKTKTTILESLKTRSVRYGGYATVITLAVVLGLILLNLAVQQFSPQFDLTKNKLFSLSEQTSQVLEKLKSPVTIYALYEPGKEAGQIKEVLDKYVAKSKNIRLEVVDPEKNPGLVSKYDKEKKGIEKGSLIIVGDKGFKVVSSMDMYDVNYANPQNPQITGFSVEKRITNALLFVSAGTTPVVYEILGHKEKQLFDLSMKETIERENYSLRPLNLIQTEIPDDASCLILNGPKTDISQGEAEKLIRYLDKGGRLLLFADFQAGPAPVLNQVLGNYGVQTDFGVVVELNKNYNTGNPFHAAPDFSDHEIVRPLRDQNTPVILQFVQGLRVLDVKRRSVEVSPLLSTSKQSFLRIDLTNNSGAMSGTDKPGPVLVAAAIRETKDSQSGKEARIVVIGCGVMLEPLSLFGQVPGNIDLFMNGITWLQDRPETLSVRTKSLITFPMNVDGLQIVIFGLLFVAVIPLALFGAGLVTWLKRRHL